MKAKAVLLDVNVLLALGWDQHEAHEAVVKRLSGRSAPVWATCPISQLGFVRISSTPGVFSYTLSPAQALVALSRLCADERHRFVGDHPSLLDSNLDALSGPRAPRRRSTRRSPMTSCGSPRGAHCATYAPCDIAPGLCQSPCILKG